MKISTRIRRPLLSLLALLALSCSGTAVAQGGASRRVVIDKPNFKIYVIDNGSDTVFVSPICTGRNPGQKQKSGDMRTPEGEFSIVQIQDASSWTHDFGDGGGERKGAYGPYFVRLRTPGFSGIGIHGTCFPERMGTRDSEGCIRLLNEELTKFVKLVKPGMKVTVLPDRTTGAKR